MPKDLALIGCGRWGKNLARVFNNLGVLHTIYDLNFEDLTLNPSPPSVEGLENKIRIAQNFETALDSSIKKVVIATPSHTHFELVQIALEAGKDVLVEKPMCFETTQAEILCKLSQKYQRILMVGHLLRYHPSFLMLQSLIKQESIGKLQSIHTIRFHTAAPRPGGVLMDLAIHDLSMALALMGSSQNIHLEIQAGSLQAVKQQKLIVTGTLGEIAFNDQMPFQQKLRLNGRLIASLPLEPLELECRHFLKACLNRLPPWTDAKESLRILGFMEQCQIETNSNFANLVFDSRENT
ncbi:MAG: Gfo/Idh/MocA family oxidoreductase [Myxococcaceae bacterium]